MKPGTWWSVLFADLNHLVLDWVLGVRNCHLHTRRPSWAAARAGEDVER